MGKYLFRYDVFWRLWHLPKSLRELRSLPRISKGDVYLDCGNHPVVCTSSELVSPSGSWLGPWDYDLTGVSLLDGSAPRSCSAHHCAPRKVSYEFAVVWLAIEPERHKALENIWHIYEQSPELRRVWS
jgi:hypothetical protein